ncbi:MAG: DUF1028 domain-containing protein [Nocardioides sp.]
MTFSLAGRCARTGQLGIVISSSSPAVAARCAWVRAGVGAVCTQNITDPRLGTALLDRLEAGAGPGGGPGAQEALAALAAETADIDYRQLTVVTAAGDVAAYSGSHALGRHAVATGAECVAAGNLLADEGVPQAMVDAFLADSADDDSALDLGDRLIAALRAALAAGGEEGPVRSCGLLIAGTEAWPLTDLRVDWDDDPVARLAEAWEVWKPQAEQYVDRALHPAGAPSFGVPGDE